MMQDHEHQLQANAMRWAALCPWKQELVWLHAIPNAGNRQKRTAGRMKAEGAKAGVWDLFLPLPRGVYHGLYLETKVDLVVPAGMTGRRRYRTTLTAAQILFRKELEPLGYAFAVYRNLDELERILQAYLKGLPIPGELLD